MSIYNGFPEKINGCNINSDFRIMIQYEKLLRNENIAEKWKIQKILDLFYIQKPQNIEKAIQGLNWFYQCGKIEKTAQGKGNAAAAYDFEQDDDLIYSAFYQTYGIDLSNTTMHWWKFYSLLLALPKDTLFMEIVGYRVADTHDMPPKMKAFYNKQKAIHAIKRSSKKYMTLEERDVAFKQEMEKRYHKAMQEFEKQKSNQSQSQ